MLNDKKEVAKEIIYHHTYDFHNKNMEYRDKLLLLIIIIRNILCIIYFKIKMFIYQQKHLKYMNYHL